MGRDYSRRKQFLPSIRCQASFHLPGTVKADEAPGPTLDGTGQTDPCEHRFDRDARAR